MSQWKEICRLDDIPRLGAQVLTHECRGRIAQAPGRQDKKHHVPDRHLDEVRLPEVLRLDRHPLGQRPGQAGEQAVDLGAN